MSKDKKKKGNFFDIIASPELVELEKEEIIKNTKTPSFSKSTEQQTKPKSKTKKKDLVTVRINRGHWNMIKFAFSDKASYSHIILNQLAEDWAKEFRPDVFEIRDKFLKP